MKKLLLAVSSIIFSSIVASAQVYDGIPNDSTTITFTTGTIPNFIADTGSVPLWQIGHSRKAFFGIDSVHTTTIMTDTTLSYPVNANNWFVIKNLQVNNIVDFWHKYQTTGSRDGGIVEFSPDLGVTWQNVKGDCNGDGSYTGMMTTNVYAKTDTLLTGEPSFNGTQDTMQYSRVQYFVPAVGPKPTFACDIYGYYYLRFRFVSDSIADSLAGWIIDSVKIERDLYPGSVAMINKKGELPVYPTPSYDGLFNFPALQHEEQFSVEVYNTLGAKIMAMPYTRQLNMGNVSKGLYFYKVTDGTEYYSGRLLTQ